MFCYRLISSLTNKQPTSYKPNRFDNFIEKNTIEDNHGILSGIQRMMIRCIYIKRKCLHLRFSISSNRWWAYILIGGWFNGEQSSGKSVEREMCVNNQSEIGFFFCLSQSQTNLFALHSIVIRIYCCRNGHLIEKPLFCMNAVRAKKRREKKIVDDVI